MVADKRCVYMLALGCLVAGNNLLKNAIDYGKNDIFRRMEGEDTANVLASCVIDETPVEMTYSPDDGWQATDAPTGPPTMGPTTRNPTGAPTGAEPTYDPSWSPTDNPTGPPTTMPSGHPTHTEVVIETRAPSLSPTVQDIPSNPDFTVQGDIEVTGVTQTEAQHSAVHSLAVALDIAESRVSVMEVISASEDRRRRMELDNQDAWDILKKGNEQRRLESDEWNIIWQAVADSEQDRDALVNVIEQPSFKNSVASTYAQVTGKSVGVRVISVTRFRNANRVPKVDAPSTCFINIEDECVCSETCGEDAISFVFDDNETMNCCCFYNDH